MSLASEFRTLAMRGKVIDLAAVAAIGGAFGTSLVGDLIKPVIGQLTAGVDFPKSALVL